MMAANGLAKLAEELGELQQVIGKKLAYYTTETHPDGGPPLTQRLQEEMADVIAACYFVMRKLKLDDEKIHRRITKKVSQFEEWDAQADNNDHGVDRHDHGH